MRRCNMNISKQAVTRWSESSRHIAKSRPRETSNEVFSLVPGRQSYQQRANFGRSTAMLGWSPEATRLAVPAPVCSAAPATPSSLPPSSSTNVPAANIQPPSATSVWPVTSAAEREASHTADPAASHALATRPRGILLPIFRKTSEFCASRSPHWPTRDTCSGEREWSTRATESMWAVVAQCAQCACRSQAATWPPDSSSQFSSTRCRLRKGGKVRGSVTHLW